MHQASQPGVVLALALTASHTLVTQAALVLKLSVHSTVGTLTMQAKLAHGSPEVFRLREGIVPVNLCSVGGNGPLCKLPDCFPEFAKFILCSSESLGLVDTRHPVAGAAA